jgi:heterotetrameric sarcosine oxidase alpha subunit
MSAQPHRLPSGGRVDRGRTLRFTFDGKPYEGFAGDTLASALLANGVRLVGRSFKYHRKRGIYSAGPEEPNALVKLRSGARAEPNTRATMVELFDGLVAESQNRWPSLNFDVMGLNSLLSPLFVAGFYYKTFMWPASLWMTYERFIRKAAGMGEGSRLPDPDHYAHRHAHCDVLVVGSGPAGIAAALSAARAGARVMVVEERAALGGALRFETGSIDGLSTGAWADREITALAAMPDVQILPRTTAFAYFDHNVVGLLERVADHVAEPSPHGPRQVLWLVRAKRVVLATGAIERPLVFADNDLPGVMLASALRRYANEFAVSAGRRAAFFTNNDSAYAAAVDLARAGVAVHCIVDARTAPPGRGVDAALGAGIEVLPGHVVRRALGRHGIEGIEVSLGSSGTTRTIPCDVLGVSGGWAPTIHLHSQSGGKLRYDADRTAFVPAAAKQADTLAGAANGAFNLADCLREGAEAGAAAATAIGLKATPVTPPRVEASEGSSIEPLWQVPKHGGGKRFVDIQDDVTAEDIALAHRENYISVEHLKRYTTLGMGTDQGKTSNINGLAIMAALRGEDIPAVGTTTFRPPYTPIALGAVAGPHVGKHLEPTRRTPLHDWHVANRAKMYEAGQWLRPRVYIRDGESFRDAWIREVNTVRGRVGIADVSTLGKIDIQGPDAAALLDRVYCNAMRSLAVGKARYGLMLGDDGIVMDDGTLARIAEHRYTMTTTTANAGKVLAMLERLLQVDWPDLRVVVSSITDQWAQIACAGPESRALLSRVVEGTDFSNAAFPMLGIRDGRVGGLPVRVFRVSYSGELAYELATPSDHGVAVWTRLIEAGATPYGLEAMGAMRIEKGHVAGPEINGQTTAADLGLGKLVSTKKDFIGKALLQRPALTDPNRLALVGLVPIDGKTPIRAGSHLVVDPKVEPPVPMIGHVTSVTWSPTLGHPIALALLANGPRRMGETMIAASPLSGDFVQVQVRSPHFFDPEGARQNG